MLASTVNLGFHTRGGPMLAVVGLCGGAGATTVAYLTAAAAAIESTAPVLLTDLGSPSAGIAAYAPVPCVQSFTAIAEHLARGDRLAGPPFAVGEFGMRLIASGPELGVAVPEEAAAAVLRQATAAHALTVLDCGQLTRPVEQVAAEHATHVAWVLPATTAGLRRGSALLRAVQKAASGREIVVARHDRDSERPPLLELAALADQRAAPLVLVPHLDDLADADTEGVLEQAALPLQALGGVLRR
jgi:Flp pilus assembly CpaE family ATPase